MTSSSNKISQLLDWGQQQCLSVSDSPQLDTEILLTHSLNKPRSYCRTWPEKVLTDNEIKHFKELISLRLKPTPIAYIVGYKEFWSRDFSVNSSTLIPRPDTELLIEKALDFLQRNSQQKTVLDLGTGTGCIAITLDLEDKLSTISATDISSGALTVAKTNAKTHSSHVEFIQSSWFENINAQNFDLIVSNPPYIPQHDEHLRQGDLPAEPITALTSGNDGLDDIRLITQQASEFLNEGGMLLIEHGYDQKEAAFKLFKKNGLKEIQQYDDYGGQTRLTVGIKQNNIIT